MSQIRVSPAQLYAAADRFRGSAQRVRSIVRRMRAALEGTTWQGVSRNRFGGRFAEWEEEAERTAAAMEELANELAYVAWSFEQADRASW